MGSKIFTCSGSTINRKRLIRLNLLSLFLMEYKKYYLMNNSTGDFSGVVKLEIALSGGGANLPRLSK